MELHPRFIQGVVDFEAPGWPSRSRSTTGLTYRVPVDKRAQLIYLRAGNSADELINLVLMRNGKPIRYFPIGAKASMHVPLAVVEDLSRRASSSSGGGPGRRHRHGRARHRPDRGLLSPMPQPPTPFDLSSGVF